MTRDDAYKILTEYTTKESLIKHALAVEICMKAYAEKYEADKEEWGIVGLLHDFDYEKYPTEEEHPSKGAEILRSLGVNEEWVKAILGHANYSGVARDSDMAKALYAVDELSGFIVACALVKPSKKVGDVSVKNVKDKLKDKRFAAAVNREDIKRGVEELGVTLDEHIEYTLETLKKDADKLGI